MPRSAISSLSARFGVTRLARITGLDRTGIEVVAAVRPRGHVLQVSQGKGVSLADAQWSALGEAIELAAAETPELERLVFGPAPHDAAWDARGLSIAWVRGETLDRGRAVSVPAETVFCPPSGVAWFGPSIANWKSNGLGAHPTSRDAALEHALLEVLERDGLARVLPDGWTEDLALERLVALEGDEFGLRKRGFAFFVFDLTPDDRKAPLAGALLFDLESDVVPLTAGYACRRSWDEAARAAILEAAQSRLTEIHGAREDVLTGDREAGGELLEVLARARPRRAKRRSVRGPLQLDRAVVVELRRDPWVVKIVGEDLLVSELL
ncbi:MAG: YcaO-like family protein [Archangium sp.]|nr:YcaO-like family protein [Archangium sp.]